MSRCFNRIASLTALILLSIVGSAAHAQSSVSASVETLAALPAPLIFARGMGIGLVIGLTFLCVGVRLSRLVK